MLSRRAVPGTDRAPSGDVVGQRVFGIALGYEDLNDHDELRHDPMLAVRSSKLAAGLCAADSPRRMLRTSTP